jgi:acyl carrier protein
MTDTEIAAPAPGDLRGRVVEKICELLPRVLNKDLPDLGENTCLMDVDLTSATTLELMLEVEDTLEIQIDVEDFERDHLMSIGTLATYVADHALTD